MNPDGRLSGEDARMLWAEQMLNQIGENVTLCVNNAFETRNSDLSEEDTKRLGVKQLLERVNIGKMLDGDIMDDLSKSVDIDVKEYRECANISTKRMYLMLLNAEQHLLENTVDKTLIMSLLGSVKHDVLMLNDKDNLIERDLYR